MYVEFERGQKFASSVADISDNHESFKDAGWILAEGDYVVDIDTLPKDVIQKLITIFDIRTQIVWTERGAHLYFKKPDGFTRGARQISPLGFEYEIKHKGNTKAVTIKRDGVLREIKNPGVREEAPFIFADKKKYAILYGMEEGEGRNQALFKLRMKLAGQDNWRKILNFVNEYIFATPLEDAEMEAVTREMMVTAEKGNEYEVATWLIDEFNYLNYGERYFFKIGNEYFFEEKKLRYEVFKRVGAQKTHYVDEVIKSMQYRAKEIDPETVFIIRFRNGFLDRGKFVDLIVDEFTPYTIDIEYKPDAEPVPEVDRYIDHLTGKNPDYRDLLLEILGHTLIVDPEFKRMLAKFFIFVGDGGNGKGTLLQIIKSILNPKNVTGMGIQELTDERYLSSFKGKLANLGDDLQDQAIRDKDMKILKNLSTCDYIATRELYKNAENTFFTGSLIFTSNHILKSWEKGESYKRRVMWLPMFTKVKKKDPLFITKLTTQKALEYWVRLIIEGYKRLYKNADFTKCQIVDDFNTEYHRKNNPALDFLDITREDQIIGKAVVTVNKAYEEWCLDNGENFNKNMLHDALFEVFGLEKRARKLNGKVTKCFLKKGLSFNEWQDNQEEEEDE